MPDNEAFVMSVVSQESTPLSTAFFSGANVEALQMSFAQHVGDATGLSLSRQDDPSLLVIMQYVFVEHARNEADGVERQVADLNDHVLAICLPQIMTGLQSYLRYIKDIATLPVPLDRAQSMDIKGTKLGYIKTF